MIADTHGLLRPEVFAVFQDLDHILHAGDVGSSDILDELNALAPVTAVSGNVDGFLAPTPLPERVVVQLAGHHVFMTHIGDDPGTMRHRHPQCRDCRVIVFGHSHRPLLHESEGVLFLNPGAAGPRRFDLPVTVALLHLGERVEAEIVELI